MEIYVNRGSGDARLYTDAFYNYLIDYGYAKEGDALLNLLYWISDDDVRVYAQVNYDIDWIEDDDEDDEIISAY